MFRQLAEMDGSIDLCHLNSFLNVATFLAHQGGGGKVCMGANHTKEDWALAPFLLKILNGLASEIKEDRSRGHVGILQPAIQGGPSVGTCIHLLNCATQSTVVSAQAHMPVTAIGKEESSLAPHIACLFRSSLGLGVWGVGRCHLSDCGHL